MKTILEATNLTKKYLMGDTELNALNNVSFSIDEGDFVAITGTSGSGKSTLMHLIGCLDTPTSGTFMIDGLDSSKASRDELAIIRNKKIGFVFQKFHLLPDLTTLDNVALPRLYAGDSEAAARADAKKMLALVELGHRIDHYPYQLSGGQQQRVAIARALINNPSIILADEPTGNLDTQTGNTIIDLFKKLNTEKNVTIIVVTHEPDIAAKARRVIELRDGIVVNDKRNQ
jgi:putative ABC transport system ATP-binding protein